MENYRSWHRNSSLFKNLEFFKLIQNFFIKSMKTQILKYLTEDVSGLIDGGKRFFNLQYQQKPTFAN